MPPSATSQLSLLSFLPDAPPNAFKRTLPATCHPLPQAATLSHTATHLCRLHLPVLVRPHHVDIAPFTTIVTSPMRTCPQEHPRHLLNLHPFPSAHTDCWFTRDHPNQITFTSQRTSEEPQQRSPFSGVVSALFIACLVLLFLCLIFSPLIHFRRALMRCCARLSIPTTSSCLPRRRAAHRSLSSSPNLDASPSSPENSLTEEVPLSISVTHPPLSAVQRRISLVVQATTLCDADARELYATGWTCCICLDDRPIPSHQLAPPIARLKCNHATHADCLRLWLEKGRAVCCLCNACVVPPQKHSSHTHTSSGSPRSSVSALDAIPGSSLVAERTEATQSSPSNSILGDLPLGDPPLGDLPLGDVPGIGEEVNTTVDVDCDE